MTTDSPGFALTDRDTELLAALDRCPLTVEQLLSVSVTFREPFQSEPPLRGRLTVLRLGGLVRRFPYAIIQKGGIPDYYRLSLKGYRVLYGPQAEPPSKRAFSKIGIARHHHTRCLSDFIVRTVIAAHERGLPLVDFSRENTLRLNIGTENLFPDCSFRLRLPDQQLNYMVELDNGSERIRSTKDADSWERKTRLYDAYQDSHSERFRVLVVTTRSRERLDRILASAGELVKNPRRGLLYGVHLDDYLAASDPLGAPCFTDHAGRHVALVPAQQLPLAPLPVARPLTAC